MLQLEPQLAATEDPHIPIKIAALGDPGFSAAERNLRERVIARVEAHVPERSTEAQAWGYRAIAHYRLRQQRLDIAGFVTLDPTAEMLLDLLAR